MACLFNKTLQFPFHLKRDQKNVFQLTLLNELADNKMFLLVIMKGPLHSNKVSWLYYTSGTITKIKWSHKQT